LQQNFQSIFFKTAAKIFDWSWFIGGHKLFSDKVSSEATGMAMI